MKTKWMITAAAAALVGFSATVQAIPITGGVSILGGYTANGTPGDLTTATSITVPGPSGALVPFGGTGSFVGAIGPVTFATPITVNSALNLVGLQLWKLFVGATPYTFTVLTESQTVDTTQQLTLVGTGTFSDGTPGDSVVGTYQIGFGVTGTILSFQNNNSVGVPDGGTTVLLLGAALSGLGLIRRKLTA